MRFEIVSKQACLIDGVGEMVPGERVVVDQVLFQAVHGYPVSEANFPSYVEVIAVLEEDPQENEGSE